jgi:hypothetical protein
MRFLGGMLLPVVLAGAGLAHAGQAAERSRSGFYGITDEDVTRLAPKAATAH